MSNLKGNSNRFVHLNECHYFQDINSTVYNFLNANIQWSLDGRHFKVNCGLFCAEYLSNIPAKCENVYDFINVMERCGFRYVCGPFEGAIDELVFTRQEQCNHHFCSGEQVGASCEDDKNYAKFFFGSHPCVYGNASFHQPGNPYGFCGHKNIEFRDARVSMLHHEIEPTPLENGSGCFNRSSPKRAAFRNDPLEAERNLSIERNMSFSSYSNNYLVENLGRCCSRNAPCPDSRNHPEEQLGFQQLRSPDTNVHSGRVACDESRGSKYHQETGTKGSVSSFPTSLNSCHMVNPENGVLYSREAPLSRPGVRQKEHEIFVPHESQDAFCDSNCPVFAGDKDTKDHHESATSHSREVNSWLPSNFFNEMPNIKPHCSEELPSLKDYQRGKSTSKHSADSTSELGRSSIFRNPDFLAELMFYTEEDSDGVFVSKASKYVMLSERCKSDAQHPATERQSDTSVISQKGHKTAHVYDCPSIVST